MEESALKRPSILGPVLIAFLYAASVGWGAIVAVYPQLAGSSFYRVYMAMIASAASWWVITDAHQRGGPIVYSLHQLIFLFWFVVAPLYLIRTRGWRGLGLAILHFTGVFVSVYLSMIIVATCRFIIISSMR